MEDSKPELVTMGDHRHFCIPVFNRATYGRHKSLIAMIGKKENLSVTVVLSSSLLMEEFGNASDYIVNGHEGVTFELIDTKKPDFTHLGMVRSAADIMTKLGDFYAKHKFTAVIVIGDRYETLPAATAASYQNIPVIHIQGGEVTGNIDDKVRHSVTKLADFHFTCTSLAQRYVLEMGEESYRAFYTGCPSIDFAKRNLKGPARRIGNRTREKLNYFICIYHPETAETEAAYDRTKAVLESVLRYCSDKGGKCYWYWPNPDPGRGEILELLEHAYKEAHPYIVKVVNTPPEDFINQLQDCRFIMGNSSAGIRESSWLGVPAINIGQRQAWRERAFNVVDTHYDVEDIYNCMVSQDRVRSYTRSYLYGDGDANKKIIQHLQCLDYDCKGPLSYPNSFKFRHDHFGEYRNYEHKRRKIRPFQTIQGKRYLKEISSGRK